MKRFLFSLLLLSLFLVSTARRAEADEWTPQHFSFEFKPGFFFPRGDDFKQAFSGCCNIFYPLEIGYLHHSRYEFDVGVGFFTREGDAVGQISGAASGEQYRLILVPISNSFTFRADFKEDQRLVPYIGGGMDYVYARENFQGTVTQFWKFGYHGHAGLQILVEGLDESDSNAEIDAGINDIYLIFEGKYASINDFGGQGLDLTGWTVSTGFLLEF